MLKMDRWADEEQILWQMWHREQGGQFSPHHPRCITSIQCRFQFNDTGPGTTCISAVPESVEEKAALAWTPLLQEDNTPHPTLAGDPGTAHRAFHRRHVAEPQPRLDAPASPLTSR